MPLGASSIIFTESLHIATVLFQTAHKVTKKGIWFPMTDFQTLIQTVPLTVLGLKLRYH